MFFFADSQRTPVLSVELHAHSAASHDGRDPVDRLVDRALEVGLDALAVTDHNTIEASLRARELANQHGLVGIPGMEISTAAGHVLGLGIESPVEKGLSFHETLDQIHAEGGIAIVPHPFQESRHGVAKHLTKDEIAMADAIEVYNSRLLTGLGNRKARRFASARGLPMTAGSDAHISDMVGQAQTLVDTDDRSLEGILDAILAGRTEVHGRRTPWHISFRQAAGGLKRRMRRRIEGFK